MSTEDDVKKIILEKQTDDEIQQTDDETNIIKVMKYRDENKIYLNTNKPFEEQISEWLVKQWKNLNTLESVLKHFCTKNDKNYIMTMIDTLFKYHPEKISFSLVTGSNFAKNYIKIKKLQKLIHKPEPLTEDQAESTLNEAKNIIDDNLMEIKDTQKQNIITYAASNSTLVYKKIDEKKDKYIAEPDTRILKYMIKKIEVKTNFLDILNSVDIGKRTALDYAISRSELKSFKVKIDGKFENMPIKYDKLIHLLITKGALTFYGTNVLKNSEKFLKNQQKNPNENNTDFFSVSSPFFKILEKNAFSLHQEQNSSSLPQTFLNFNFLKSKSDDKNYFLKFQLDKNYGRFVCNFKLDERFKYAKIIKQTKRNNNFGENRNKGQNIVFIYTKEETNTKEETTYLYFRGGLIPIELYDTTIILKPPKPTKRKTIVVEQLITALNSYTKDNDTLELDNKKLKKYILIKTNKQNGNETRVCFHSYQTYVFIQLLCFFYVKVQPIIKNDSDITIKLKNDDKKGPISYTRIFNLLYFMYNNAYNAEDMYNNAEDKKTIQMLDKFVPISIFQNRLVEGMYGNLLKDGRNEKDILKLLLKYASMEKIRFEGDGTLKKINLYDRVELKF